MSRIGKKPVPIPNGVEVKLADKNIRVKGPKGELVRDIHPRMEVSLEDSQILVKRPTDEGPDRALHGLTRSLINNMVIGVSEGFTKTLMIEGVGYKAAVKGNVLNLALGYSHPIDMDIPKGIEVNVDKNTIVVKCNDKEKLGHFCAEIRFKRPPEPYKGKGVRYSTETIRRKAGKKGL